MTFQGRKHYLFIQYLSLSFHAVKGKSLPKGILDKLTSPSFFDNVLASQRDGPAWGLFRGVMKIHAFSHGIPFDFGRLGKRKACINRQNYYIVI
jgi:hypothetical protein